MDKSITGAEILIESLLNHNISTIFGYPGSCVMIILDHLYNYKDPINHILVRHEQGAIHAAQGYAQASNKVGVALLTSGPGATNTVTGIANAMANSTPLVVITGQVHSKLIGTDAFQEVDIISITHSITKWTYQIRSANEIASALAHAFYVASTGRPGPVLIDITKDSQIERAPYIPQKVDFIRSYSPILDKEQTATPTLLSSSDKEENSIIEELIDILNNTGQNLTLVLDVNPNYEFKPDQSTTSHKIIKSEKFETMGFGLPAAIGAKYAEPDKTVCLIVNSEQFQATIQELGVIMQSLISIKIFLLNNNQKAKPEVRTPNFTQVMKAYNIQSNTVSNKEKLKADIQQAIKAEGSYFLEIIQ